MIIESLKKKHMGQVVQLLSNLSDYMPPRESYDEIWKLFSSQTNVYSVVVIFDEYVVGYGSLVVETKIRGGRLGHIEDIVSHPNTRGMGIGKLIIEYLYNLSAEQGCYKVSLQCQQHNISFYEKCGYAVRGAAMERVVKYD